MPPLRNAATCRREGSALSYLAAALVICPQRLTHRGANRDARSVRALRYAFGAEPNFEYPAAAVLAPAASNHRHGRGERHRNNRRSLQRQCVSDAGPRIPAEHQTRIFEQFQQVDNSNTRARAAPVLVSLLPSRSLRCTAVASGSSRPWVRAQPSKWNSPPERNFTRWRHEQTHPRR